MLYRFGLALLALCLPSVLYSQHSARPCRDGQWIFIEMQSSQRLPFSFPSPWQGNEAFLLVFAFGGPVGSSLYRLALCNLSTVREHSTWQLTPLDEWFSLSAVEVLNLGLEKCGNICPSCLKRLFSGREGKYLNQKNLLSISVPWPSMLATTSW